MDRLDGMRAFVATVEAQSFTRAADRLGISNKLVSKYVARLEDSLKVRLLHRTTRKLSLTVEGQRYYEGCVDLLAGLEGLEGSLKSQSQDISGVLRLAAPSNFGEAFLMPRLVAFQRAYPDITLDIALSDRYVDLASEGFDLAIRLGDFRDGSIITRKLGELESWIVASPALLDTIDPPHHPNALARLPCLRDSNLAQDAVWQFADADGRFGVRVSGTVRINSAIAIRQLALEGQGIAMTPSIFVEDDIRAGRLVRLFETYDLRRVDIRIAYLSAANLPTRHRAFIDFLADAFEGERHLPGR